jgi:hypothetical protein
MSTSRKWVTLLFNPFYYLAGGGALGLGLLAILAAALIGSCRTLHFDGVLDMHIGAAVPVWFYLAEGLVDWLSLAVVLWVAGKIISGTSFRAVDVFGTQALARWPTVVISLLALPPAFQRFSKDIVEQIKRGNFEFNTPDAIVFFAIGICVVPILCWMIYLMYKGFSVSCNVKGGKAIGTFIGGLIAAEVLSKILIVALFHFANPGVGAPPAAAQAASAPVAVSPARAEDEPGGDVQELGRQFVTLLAKQDFATAESWFDPAMKAAMPESRLRTVWTELLGQAGALRTQLGARLSSEGGYRCVYVTCQFERSTLDLKVVFDADQRVAGLFVVASSGAGARKGN